MLELLINNESEMQILGEQLASASQAPLNIFLHGALGAGKTTLVRSYIQKLGINEKIKSPTYTIVEPYQSAEYKIFHFDFYRILDPEELELIGIKDYFSQDAICLIEWPEKAETFLPKPDIALTIKIKDDTREIKIQSNTAKGKEILEKLRRSR